MSLNGDAFTAPAPAGHPESAARSLAPRSECCRNSGLAAVRGCGSGIGSKPKILVVDDTMDMVDVLRFHLTQQGYQVVAAYSGEEAIRLVAAEVPDVILMDVSMPGMNGMQVCQHLKTNADWARIPVILVTCHDSDRAIADGLDAGADDYITKPFSPTVLGARVRAALRAKAAGDRLRDANEELEEEICERRRVEQVLSAMEEQLRQTQKLEAIGRLAGGIAHEFNNLLQAIGGYTNFAMKGLDPEEHRYEDLQQVLKASERASMLTRQLLGFSRRQALERRLIDPNQLVADTHKLIRSAIGEHIDLQMVLDENPGTLHADPGELQQALLNLCLNARDAMPRGGTLLLKTESAVLDEAVVEFGVQTGPGHYVVINVTDTGCGMTPEVKQRIFEPFFTTKEVGKGTGLGLANVHGIVQQHNGTIHVDSEPGKGTTFRVFLPATRSAPDAEPVRELVACAGGHETILLAEDERMVRALAERTLKKAGYTVLTAADGEEALAVLRENRGRIALALLDAVMPKSTGTEVARWIRAQGLEMKVLLCTGYDPNSFHCNYAREEGLRLLQKPYQLETLLRTVREVLNAEEDENTHCQVLTGTTE